MGEHVKRPYLTYLLAAVVPSAVAAVVLVAAADDAWATRLEDSHRRVADMVLKVVDQELARTAEALLPAAAPVPEADPADPSVVRAMAGDTLTGYRPGASGLEVVVVLGGSDGGPVRMAAGPVDPAHLHRLSGSTGYALASYVRGVRWAAAPEGTGPETLDERLLSRAGERQTGVQAPGGSGWVHAHPGTGTPPALVALVAPPAPLQPAVERPVLLVVGLLLLFAVLAGWIQLVGPSPGGHTAPSRASVGLLALLPGLVVLGLASHLDREFLRMDARATSRDLTRALSVAALRGAATNPEAVRNLTGFHAARIRSGVLLASTWPHGDVSRLAALPAPPPSFTATGSTETPDGEARYVALRLREGGFVVAAAPTPDPRYLDFHRRVRGVLWTLGGWFLFALTAAWMATRAPRGGDATSPSSSTLRTRRPGGATGP